MEKDILTIEAIYRYLLEKGLAWCFVNGQLVSREDCEKIIK